MASKEREKLPIPSMSVEDVVGLVESFGNKTKLTEEDLKRPQFKTLKNWYLNSILLDQLGIAQERLLQPHFSSITTLEHPELHEESASLLMFTLTLQRFMFACGVEDFTISDLLTPNPKRALHNISAVLNFIKFKNFQKEPYDKMLEEMESFEEKMNQSLERNAAMRQRIDKLRVQRAEEEAQAEQISGNVEKLETEIRELNRDQAAESKKYQQLKTTNAEQSTKKAEYKVALAGQKEHCENLKSKIVQSPDRFKAEITRLSNHLDNVKSSKDEKAKRLTELDNLRDRRLRCNENMTNALKLLKAVGTDIERQSELAIQLEERQDKCRAQNEALKDIALKIQHCKRQSAAKQDKALRSRRQHEKKIAVLQEQCNELKRDEASYMEKNVGVSMEKCKDIDRKMQDIVHMMEEKENDANKEISSLRESYSKLLEQVNIYHQGLNEGWSDLANVLS